MTTSGRTAEEWFDIACMHYAAGHLKRGRIAHQQVMQLDPGGPQAQILTGIALTAENRFEEALAAYEQAISLAPHESLAHLQKGIALTYLGRFEEALAAYEQALQLDPASHQAPLQQATVLLFQGRYEDGLELSDKSLAEDLPPASRFYALMNKAAALCGLMRYDDALAIVDQMIRLAPLQPEGYAALGDIQEHLGYDQAALSAYNQALRRATRVPNLWISLAELLRRLHAPGDALVAYEQALQLGYQGADCWYGKGEALMDLQRFAEALSAYEQALALSPDDPEIEQRYEDALEALEEEGTPTRPSRGLALRLAIARSLRELRYTALRLEPFAWAAFLACAAAFLLALVLHLDVRPICKALLSVTLPPLEVLTILLYPVVCVFAWRRYRRTGFHPRITRSGAFGPAPLPARCWHYVWRPRRPDPVLLKIMRATIAGLVYITIITSALSLASTAGVIAQEPGPLTIAIFLGGNLLVALNMLIAISAAFLFCAESLIRGLAAALKQGVTQARPRRQSRKERQAEAALVAAAEGLQSAEEPETSLAQVDLLLAQHPASPVLLLAKADLLQQLARQEEALAPLNKALALTHSFRSMDPEADPRYEARARKTHLLHLLGRTNEAITACEEALADYGCDPLLHSYRGLLLLELGHADPALVAFEHALQFAGREVGTNSPVAYYLMNKGNALWALGRTQEAMRIYALAKRQLYLPTMLQSALLYNLAGTLALLGRREEALAYYQEIGAQEPERPWACYAQAEVLALLGRDEEALAAYRQVEQGAESVDREVTRRSLRCMFVCPLGYERQGQGVFAYRWQVGSGRPQWPQSREQEILLPC